MKMQVLKVLESTAKSAREMTHALAVLGDDNMNEGVRRFYSFAEKTGIEKGFVGGVLLIGTIWTTYEIFKRTPIRMNKLKKEEEKYIRETNNKDYLFNVEWKE